MQILLTQSKLDSLLALLAGVSHLDGCIAELGVYQGGTLLKMAQASPGKTCYGFDTFAGQPAESWRAIDFHKPGEFADTLYESVLFAMPGNVKLKGGLFPHSAAGVDEKFCFAHVDFDLEKSTEDAIAWLMPRMVSGGLLVFDDYRWKNCAGVARAIEAAGLSVIESAPNQCYWIAP